MKFNFGSLQSNQPIQSQQDEIQQFQRQQSFDKINQQQRFQHYQNSIFSTIRNRHEKKIFQKQQNPLNFSNQTRFKPKLRNKREISQFSRNFDSMDTQKIKRRQFFTNHPILKGERQKIAYNQYPLVQKFRQVFENKKTFEKKLIEDKWNLTPFNQKEYEEKKIKLKSNTENDILQDNSEEYIENKEKKIDDERVSLYEYSINDDDSQIQSKQNLQISDEEIEDKQDNKTQRVGILSRITFAKKPVQIVSDTNRKQSDYSSLKQQTVTQLTQNFPQYSQDQISAIKKLAISYNKQLIQRNKVKDEKLLRILKDLTFQEKKEFHCVQMCPKKEIEERDQYGTREKLEMIRGKKDKLAQMIKKFQRSSADKELKIASILRPPYVLYEVVKYLIKVIMPLKNIEDQQKYEFIINRMRCVKQDFQIIFSIDKKFKVYKETILSYELMIQYQILHINQQRKYLKDFDEKLSKQYLNDSLKNLISLYSYGVEFSKVYETDQNKNTINDFFIVNSPNKEEFIIYDLIFTLFESQSTFESSVNKYITLFPSLTSDKKFTILMNLYQSLANNQMSNYLNLLKEGELFMSLILSIKYFLNKIRIIVLVQFDKILKEIQGSSNVQFLKDYLFFEDEESFKEFIEFYIKNKSNEKFQQDILDMNIDSLISNLYLNELGFLKNKFKREYIQYIDADIQQNLENYQSDIQSLKINNQKEQQVEQESIISEDSLKLKNKNVQYQDLSQNNSQMESQIKKSKLDLLKEKIKQKNLLKKQKQEKEEIKINQIIKTQEPEQIQQIKTKQIQQDDQNIKSKIIELRKEKLNRLIQIVVNLIKFQQNQQVKKSFKKWQYIKNCVNEKYLKLLNKYLQNKNQKLKKTTFDKFRKKIKQQIINNNAIFKQILNDMGKPYRNKLKKTTYKLKSQLFCKNNFDHIRYPIYQLIIDQIKVEQSIFKNNLELKNRRFTVCVAFYINQHCYELFSTILQNIFKIQCIEKFIYYTEYKLQYKNYNFSLYIVELKQIIDLIIQEQIYFDVFYIFDLRQEYEKNYIIDLKDFLIKEQLKNLKNLLEKTKNQNEQFQLTLRHKFSEIQFFLLNFDQIEIYDGLKNIKIQARIESLQNYDIIDFFKYNLYQSRIEKIMLKNNYNNYIQQNNIDINKIQIYQSQEFYGLLDNLLNFILFDQNQNNILKIINQQEQNNNYFYKFTKNLNKQEKYISTINLCIYILKKIEKRMNNLQSSLNKISKHQNLSQFFGYLSKLNSTPNIQYVQKEIQKYLNEFLKFYNPTKFYQDTQNDQFIIDQKNCIQKQLFKIFATLSQNNTNKNYVFDRFDQFLQSIDFQKATKFLDSKLKNIQLQSKQISIKGQKFLKSSSFNFDNYIEQFKKKKIKIEKIEQPKRLKKNIIYYDKNLLEEIMKM